MVKKSKCSKCGSETKTYPVNFSGCKELCLDCRWQLVRIHNRTVALDLPSENRGRIFAKFFASRDGYNNIMEELEEYDKEKS